MRFKLSIIIFTSGIHLKLLVGRSLVPDQITDKLINFKQIVPSRFGPQALPTLITSRPLQHIHNSVSGWSQRYNLAFISVAFIVVKHTTT